MFGRFKIKGSRPHIRTMQEMAQVDKSKADEAFKCNKQQILDEFLLSQGFVKYKTKAYVRRSRIDVLEYIDVQKERYGSKSALERGDDRTSIIAENMVSLELPKKLVQSGYPLDE